MLNFNQDLFSCTSPDRAVHPVLNDLYPDCSGAEDEPTLSDVFFNRKEYSCTEESQLPCQEGHRNCFHVKDTCVYRLSKYGHLIPCRSGEHMQECFSYECNHKFKCPGAHSIPWGYLCDGKWDCLHGEDELTVHGCAGSRHMFCSDLFRCRDSATCIHLRDVCDNIGDCPHSDDEAICDLKGITCPTLCMCHIYALVCSGHHFKSESFHQQYPHMYLLAAHSKIGSLDFLQYFQHLIHLDLSHNSLETPCKQLNGRGTVQHCDVSHNHITVLEKHCFCDMTNLTSLLLNDNLITEVDVTSFPRIPGLQMLNMSGNHLLTISNVLLQSIRGIITLSLAGNPLTSVGLSLFDNTDIDSVETEDFRICCLVSGDTTCVAEKAWYQSCSSLLPFNSMRIVLITVSCLVVVLNVVSGAVQHVLDVSKMSAFKCAILSLNCTDCVWSIYLAILITADAVYGKGFFLNEFKWRASFPCFTSLSLSFLFSLLSPTYILYMCLFRLNVVLWPFSPVLQTKTKALLLICISGAVACLGSASLAIGYFSVKPDIPTSLCLPFVDPRSSNSLVKYTTLGTAAFQTGISVFICIIYAILLQNVFKSSEEMSKTRCTRQSNKGLVVQIFIVSMSNLFCQHHLPVFPGGA